MIEEGKKAPTWTLVDHADEKVQLEDFAGQWLVLYFYPKDDTPGCTTQACDFTAGIQQFESLKTQVVGCSPDSPESHRAFIAKHDLAVRLISDPDHGMMEAYGAWGEKNMYGKVSVGVIRSTVIIDPEGVVRKHYKRASAKGHAEAVRTWLEENAT